MKIYLHIGTEKTGTTSIQSFLADNRDELHKHKIMYSKVLGDPNNIRLSIALQDTDKIDDSRIHAKITTKEKILNFKEELRSDLSEEIQKEKPEILIISSEHLSSRMNREKEIKRLKYFLNQFSDDITVIVYLRRQDKFFESLYSTAIKKGNVIDFSFPDKGREGQNFHYNRMLKLWENVFGFENIKVNIFEKSRLFQKDVISDFIHTLNLPIKYEKGKEKRENLSFGRKKLAFLKEFNNFIPEIINHRVNPSRGNIEKLLENIDIEDELIKMSNIEKSKFLEIFASGNQEISNRYFHNEKIFDVISSNNKEKIDTYVSSAELMEIISKIWSAKQRECIDNFFTIKTLQIELELAKGNNHKALNLAESFHAQYPNHPKTNYLYAKTLLSNQKINDARSYCKRALELNPENKEFLELFKILEGKIYE